MLHIHTSNTKKKYTEREFSILFGHDVDDDDDIHPIRGSNWKTKINKKNAHTQIRHFYDIQNHWTAFERWWTGICDILKKNNNNSVTSSRRKLISHMFISLSLFLFFYQFNSLLLHCDFYQVSNGFEIKSILIHFKVQHLPPTKNR